MEDYVEGLDRVANLLAAILIHDMKDAPLADKAMQLSRAGMTNQEIARLLGTTPATVKQSLYYTSPSKEDQEGEDNCRTCQEGPQDGKEVTVGKLRTYLNRPHPPPAIRRATFGCPVVTPEGFLTLCR